MLKENLNDMDAQKIYLLLKPHLQNLDSSEKRNLSRMICCEKPGKVTCQHRKVLPVSKAIENLELNRKIFIAQEQREKNL